MTEIQQKIIKVLRTTGKKQGKDAYFNWETDCYCASGLIACEVFNWNLRSCFPTKEMREVFGGIPVVGWNDYDNLSFKQIAAKLEEVWS